MRLPLLPTESASETRFASSKETPRSDARTTTLSPPALSVIDAASAEEMYDSSLSCAASLVRPPTSTGPIATPCSMVGASPALITSGPAKIAQAARARANAPPKMNGNLFFISHLT